jgi:FtsZ-interacting cell division protein ZipA
MVDQMRDIRPILVMLGIAIIVIGISGLWPEWRKRWARKNEPTPISIIISFSNEDEEEDNLDGCAEAAIEIINHQWASRSDNDDSDEQEAMEW